MIEIKECRGPCGRRLPKTHEFFGPLRERKADGSDAVRWRPRCRECARVAQRTYSRRYEDENRSDPSRAHMREHRLREQSRRSRERYEADPELQRQRVRDSRRRRRKNAAVRKAQRERNRMQRRLQREREGVALAEMRSGAQWNSIEAPSEYAAAFERLPAWPLGEALREEDARRQREHYGGYVVDLDCPQGDIAGAHLRVPGWSDSTERNVRAWTVGERMDVQFDVADRVLTALDWCWWEVFNERTVRKHSLVVALRSPVKSKRNPERMLPAGIGCSFAVTEHGIYGSPLPPRASKYTTTRRWRVGDEGPDLEVLEQVRHTFECTGFPSCSTCRDRRESEQVQMVLGEAA
jgi:hypothetical protein